MFERRVSAQGVSLVGVGLAALLLSFPAASAAKPRCAGKKATIVGTAGNDRIVAPRGGKGVQVVVARGGNDRITVGKGGDVVCGGAGNDILNLGGGPNKGLGGGGNDKITGGAVKDKVLDGGSGDDTIVAGFGSETVDGGSGDDDLDGGGDSDVVLGEDGDDTLEGADGADDVSGGVGDDSIGGGDGADEIRAGPGNDTVDAGAAPDKTVLGESGDDTMQGGEGADTVDGGDDGDSLNGGDAKDILRGGNGNDELRGGGGGDISLYGEGGNDEILGGPGADTQSGGPGNDRLFAGLQDDFMDGDDGDDLLVGGHGIDDMDAGSGDDWLRGDVNGDRYKGDIGTDTASFAAATPPGATGPNITGVRVNLSTQTAAGDEGGGEVLSGIENAVGSQFNDEITAANGSSKVDAGAGDDTCTGFAAANKTSCGIENRTNAILFTTGLNGPDPGLVMLSQTATNSSYIDTWEVIPVSGGVKVTYSSTPSGTLNLLPASTCAPTATPGTSFCALDKETLGYVLVWGEGGGDSITVEPGLDPATHIMLDGGTGNDTIAGGDTGELMVSGIATTSPNLAGGADSLTGNGGDDALYANGPDKDTLSGSDGNDQFVVDNACGGHDLIGGAGDADVAGFGAATTGVQATLGGNAEPIPVLAPCNSKVVVRADNEVLEGGPLADLLFGDSRDNPLILGREGADEIHGGLGDDVLRGQAGADTLLGEGGVDELQAQFGAGDADAQINCGAQGGTALIDVGLDPNPIGCS